MPKTLYRPRGIDKETGRENWIAKNWYLSRKDAMQTVQMSGSDRYFHSIKIVSAPNQTYKGKWVLDRNISRMF